MFVRETTKTAVASASCGCDRCTKTHLGETILVVSSDHAHPKGKPVLPKIDEILREKKFGLASLMTDRTVNATMWELRFQKRKRKYKDQLSTFVFQN